MTQRVIHEHAGQHGFGDWRGANPDAGVVPARGFNRYGISVNIDRAPRDADAGGRLQRDRYRDVLPGGDAAENAAVVVADEALRRHLVAVLAALLRDRAEPGADLHAFHRVDRHHRAGDVGIEPAIDRLAPADRHALRDHVDARAARVAALAQLVNDLFQLGNTLRIGRKERIAIHFVPRLERDLGLPQRSEIAPHRDAVFFLQPLLRDRARRDAHHGLARRGAAAAACVADAVFLPIGIV